MEELSRNSSVTEILIGFHRYTNGYGVFFTGCDIVLLKPYTILGQPHHIIKDQLK